MVNNELELLFEDRHYSLAPWIIGKVPKHYKRLSCSEDKARELAEFGAVKVASYFGDKLYYTQSIIAGAVLGDDYDRITIVTTSSYGKSWLMGRLGVILAYEGNPVYIAAANTDGTRMIMGHVIQALQTVAPEVRNALLNKKDQIERLATSVSKARLAFSNGGFAEAITLGGTYNDNVAANKAVGKPGNFIVDEASLVPEDAFGELGRADLARIDKKRYKTIMISNPHKPGFFYDRLVEETDERSIVIWMDALTAVEEERITEDAVFNGTFAKNRSTLRRYLLCVLDSDSDGMFSVPQVYTEFDSTDCQWFLGVDAAYKGKDNIQVALCCAGNGKIRITDVMKIEKKKWIDGITSKDVARRIARLCYDRGVAMVCVDIGWGVWLVEALNDFDIDVRGVSFSSSPTPERMRARQYAATNAINKRAEMHLDFQDLVENGILEMSEDAYEQIRETLPLITSERKSNGKIQIVPKSEVKVMLGHSPDEFDAVLLALHACIRFLGESVYAIP